MKIKLTSILIVLFMAACLPATATPGMGSSPTDQIFNSARPPEESPTAQIAASATNTEESPTVTTPAQTEETAPSETAAATTSYLPLIKSATPPLPPPSGALIADHRAVNLFDQIPDSALPAAIAIRALQMHASTGNRIDNLGLNCVQGTRQNENCDPYPDYKYDRRNWLWEEFNPPTTDTTQKMDLFVASVNQRHNAFDVFGMKYCYLDTNPDSFTYYRDQMLQLEAQYPGKIFIWWTQALKPGLGSCSLIENFNTQVRAYALANHKPLLDLADVESHDPQGNPCFTGCETMCREYGANPSQDDNGHMNIIGNIRAARAYWWLLSRIAGWDGQTD